MTIKASDASGIVISAEDALTDLRNVAPQKFTELFTHGSLSVEIYAPGSVDDQTPHDRDELYVVIKGNGEFVYGDQRSIISPGDCLFVPAHVEHRFVNYTPDLTVWVFFYGPEGGEGASKEGTAPQL